MEGSASQLQAELIQQQLTHLQNEHQAQQNRIQQSKTSIFHSHLNPSAVDPDSDPNKHRFNHYADKQLMHLVVAEEFDFERIASTLNYIFREERLRFSELSCRERWEELHCLRERGQRVREKRMEDKRATSVSAFSDPYSLYNLEEMVDKLKMTEKNQKDQQINTQQLTNQNSNPNSPNNNSSQRQGGSGYNIFKNSIRQIDDLQQYKQRQQEMLKAMESAQSKTVTDKLMHFEPYYERLNHFEVHEQELTEQKMKEIMSRPIQMQRMEKELRVKDMNEVEEEWASKRTKREEQKMEEKEHQYEIEDDWDEYESD